MSSHIKQINMLLLQFIKCNQRRHNQKKSYKFELHWLRKKSNKID